MAKILLIGNESDLCTETEKILKNRLAQRLNGHQINFKSVRTHENAQEAVRLVGSTGEYDAVIIINPSVLYKLHVSNVSEIANPALMVDALSKTGKKTYVCDEDWSYNLIASIDGIPNVTVFDGTPDTRKITEAVLADLGPRMRQQPGMSF